MWIWLCPNHIKAIMKVFFAETPLLRRWTFEISFKVTDKGKVGSNVFETLGHTWLFLVYMLAFIASTLYFIIIASIRRYSGWEIVLNIAAIGWGAYACICMWPPVSTLLPREEMEQGWRIRWEQWFDSDKFDVDTKNRVVRTNQSGALKWDSKGSVADYEKGRSLNRSLRTMSLKRMFSENSGRVALPGKTITSLLQSGMLTSTLLPEPSIGSGKVDTRELSIDQVYSQYFDKLAQINSSKGFSGCLPDIDAGIDEEMGQMKTQKMIQDEERQEYRICGDDSTDVQNKRTGLSRSPDESQQSDGIDKKCPPSAFKEIVCDLESSKYSHTTLDDEETRKRGLGILRSMSRSQTNIMHRNSRELGSARQPSKMNGEDIVDSKQLKQQMSTMLSSCFSNLLDLQPSALEENGFVIPVVPASIFDHTIAGRPSFEFRTDPEDNIWFYLVNAAILAGAIAGLILSVIYQGF